MATASCPGEAGVAEVSGGSNAKDSRFAFRRRAWACIRGLMSNRAEHSVSFWQRRWVAHLFALAVTLAVLGLRMRLAPWFADRPMLLLFVLPIFLSGFVGGLGPGLVATATAALGTSYYLIPPLHSFAWAQAGPRPGRPWAEPGNRPGPGREEAGRRPGRGRA